MHRESATPAPPTLIERFGALWGAFLGLALLKFGNPVVLDRQIPAPSSFEDLIFQPWPARWANALLLLLVLAAAAIRRLAPTPSGPPLPKSWIALPLGWFGWQCVSASFTVDAPLTALALPQFAGVVLSFFTGAFLLGRHGFPRFLWIALLAAFAFVLVRAANQHWVEFKRDRQALVEGERSGWKDVPQATLERMRQDGLLYSTNGLYRVHPAILLKLEKGRVNGTLVYPNALASCLILLAPFSAWALWQTRALLRPWLAWLAIMVAVGLCVGTFYWTGSKSGWLIAVAQIAWVLSTRLPASRRLRWSLAIAAVALGLGLFIGRFNEYLAKGATSASARLDYWQAAVATTLEHPITGTGPGTFQRPYAQRKRPESEMARLTHNDYLEQASDSGLPGAAIYLAWITLVLKRLWQTAHSGPLAALNLGVTGWFVHGLVEFGLYIPALAWTAFTLLGVLAAASGSIASPSQSPKAAPAPSQPVP